MIHKISMIIELKKEVEAKFGKKVENRGDCEMISNTILELLDVEISYNTLRRMYELVPYTKPNTKTLNTLAQFVGYNNYFHFSQNYSFKEKTKLFQITYKSLYDDNEAEILELVKRTKRSAEDFVDFITLLLRELFYKKKYSLINAIFNLKELHYSNFSYSELLYVGNSVGLILRKENRVHKILIKNINFLNCIYLTFVDYSSLNSYYGKWASSLKRINTSEEIELFNNAVLQFKNFLNNKKIKVLDKDLIYRKDLHPILCSRLLALKFLTPNTPNVTSILTNYYKVHSIRKNSTDYSYELFTTAILTKNIKVMQFLVEKSDLTIKLLHQKHHLNSFYLMSAFYYKLSDNKAEALKNFNHFSLNECRYSYEEFIKLIYLIYMYEDSKLASEKNQIRMRYKTLSEKLNYPYFSEAYLFDYFK
ncbi:MAG: hypothetical protein P8P13_00995 [Flavobacteriaceae bacterium]|nr:hypothetical protein [Flavobacteriaceae bacterium]